LEVNSSGVQALEKHIAPRTQSEIVCKNDSRNVQDKDYLTLETELVIINHDKAISSDESSIICPEDGEI